MTPTPTPGREPAVPRSRLWFLGVGFLGIQLAFAVYNAFLPLLYRQFLDSRAVIGLLMGTDNLVGLLLIPVVGAWSDRIHSPLGRRLPFIVVGIPVAAATLAAIPYAAAVLWILIVTEVAFTAAMHLYRGPMAAIIIDHTPPRRRSTASAIAQFLGGVGVLLSFAVLARLFDVDQRLPFVLGAVVLLASLGVVWWQAERFPAYVDNLSVGTGSPLRGILGRLRHLARGQQRGAVLVLTAMLVVYSGFAGLQAMLPIYGVEVVGLSEGEAAFLLTAFAAAMLVAVLLAGWIGTRIGPVPTMLVGTSVLAVLYLVATGARTAATVAGVLVVAGAVWPLFAVPAVALAGDLGGREQIGFHLGLYYVFTMLGQMVGPFLLGTAMDVFGEASMWLAAAVITAVGGVVLHLGGRALGRPAPAVAIG
ncbi:MAG: MFS transporter [Nitriliruptoraceae bacterium]